MNISESTRVALGDNLEIALTATRENHPGLDAVLHELHAGLSRLMPTRPAEAGELAPVVTALGAPGVPREAIELLQWMARRHESHRHEDVSVEFKVYGVASIGARVEVLSLTQSGHTVALAERGPSLAEAARAALEKVSRG